MRGGGREEREHDGRLMQTNARQEEAGRRPGFPVDALALPNRSLAGPGLLSRGLTGLSTPLRLLGVSGLLGLTILVLPDRARDLPESAPRVAELASSLSLPVAMNRRVEVWIRRYLTDQRSVFERYLARQGLYEDMIHDALRRRGMPEDLVYLAAIESGFSPAATSKVAASGMWQFMGPTAQAFGLRIDAYVDERRDPIRATEAALDYLQSLYDQFGSWYLAAAAYNAGPGRVARALAVTDVDVEKGGDEAFYWDIVGHLPVETREYVPKMLAAILLSRAAVDYGFTVESAQPVRFEKVWVPAGTSLKRVAQSVKIPLGKIRELNPHLIRGITPPDGLFPVRVPPGSSSLLVAAMGGRWRKIAVDDDD